MMYLGIVAVLADKHGTVLNTMEVVVSGKKMYLEAVPGGAGDTGQYLPLRRQYANGNHVIRTMSV